MAIYFYVTPHGVSHVTIDVCGGQTTALESCQDESRQWIFLVLEHFKDESIYMSCNGVRSVTFGEECARKVGTDITYFSLTQTFEGSLKYKSNDSGGKDNVVLMFVYPQNSRNN